MNQQVRQQMYLASMLEMQKKLNSYESKPDANAAYIAKNKAYISAIESYVTELENQIRDARFNREFIIVTGKSNTGDDINDRRMLREAERKIKQYEAILESKGIKQCDIPYMLQQSKDIDRHNNIKRVKELWSELY